MCLEPNPEYWEEIKKFDTFSEFDPLKWKLYVTSCYVTYLERGFRSTSTCPSHSIMREKDGFASNYDGQSPTCLGVHLHIYFELSYIKPSYVDINITQTLVSRYTYLEGSDKFQWHNISIKSFTF